MPQPHVIGNGARKVIALNGWFGNARGWGPMTRAEYEQAAGPDGALFIGAPETVAAKIAKVARALDLARFDLKYSLGTLPHERLMESLRLYATEVAPRVRRALAG